MDRTRGGCGGCGAHRPRPATVVLAVSALAASLTGVAASALSTRPLGRATPSLWRLSGAPAAAGAPPPPPSGLGAPLSLDLLSPPLPATGVGADDAAIDDAGDLDGGSPSERVIGGTLFQWQAPTGFHAKFFVEKGRSGFTCAGTLITRRHILTAAHCEIDANMTAALGGLRLDQGLPIPIGRVTVHPDYMPALSRSDIAVVELGREVKWSEMKAYGLKMVRLNPWPALPPKGSSPLLTGWGRRIQGPGGVISDQMIKAKVTVLDVDDCNDLYQQYTSESIVKSQEVCAGLRGRRSCNGDSGGPMWQVDSTRKNGYVQFGVVSSAIGSKRYPCDINWPTVFMRTSYYYDWIGETIGKKYKLL